MKNKNLIAILILTAIFIPIVVSAVQFDPFGQLQNVDLGKPTEDEVPGMFVLIINIVLGFLTLIAVTLIIVSGFLYMLSGGDTEKITKAKKLLYGTIIGLFIVMMAWGITLYVINQLNVVTMDPYPV